MVSAFRVQIQEEGDDDDDVVDLEEDTEEQQDDFDHREEDQANAFGTLGRVSCFAHTLQLVVTKISEVAALKGILNRARTLTRRVNSSVKATERLVSLTGKKLVRDCATRWSSTYLMISRMLEVRSDLTHVLEDLQWDNLPISDWKLLHAIQEMLEPFAIFTTLVQGEDFTTVSCVIPSIMDLTLHLEEFKSNPGVSEAAELLLTELKRRFRKYTDPGDLEHEPLFLVATALDPRYKLLLNAVQLGSAKKELFKRLKEAAKEKNGTSSTSDSESLSQDISITDRCEEPPTKLFRHLDRILEARVKEGLRQTSSLPPGKAEVERYFQSVESAAEKVDPLTYWIDQEDQYPLLSAVAVDILAIPATSAPVERVFSTAGESTVGKRNRLSDKNLECEVLLRKNRHFL